MKRYIWGSQSLTVAAALVAMFAKIGVAIVVLVATANAAIRYFP
jgi:hypothetical protein